MGAQDGITKFNHQLIQIHSLQVEQPYYKVTAVFFLPLGVKMPFTMALSINWQAWEMDVQYLTEGIDKWHHWHG